MAAGQILGPHATGKSPGRSGRPVAERGGSHVLPTGEREAFRASHPALVKYAAKIERRAALPAEARAAIHALPFEEKLWDSHQDVVREHDRPTRICLVDDGLVSRYKILWNGSRQIVSFHIPGDMVHLQSALVIVSDRGIRTHMPTNIVSIRHADILQLVSEHPPVERALWFDTLIDAAIAGEWTVNVGRRDTRERTAHLLLEFAARFSAAGLVLEDTFELPLSQTDLSDALGMTSVHLNRTMQWLRRQHYIRTRSRSITIENRLEMIGFAGFDPIYLHPEGRRPAYTLTTRG